METRLVRFACWNENPFILFGTVLDPVWFVQALKLCHTINDDDLQMGSNGICCGAITSCLVWRSWWELLQYGYKSTFWRAMQHRAVWCENRPGFEREFIHSHSLLDVDIRVALTYHNHPSEKGLVLSQVSISFQHTFTFFALVFQVQSVVFFIVNNVDPLWLNAILDKAIK